MRLNKLVFCSTLLLIGIAVYLYLPSDTDGDGHPNEEDNCVLVHNIEQADWDKDGKGDPCDDDDDNDGVTDAIDAFPLNAKAQYDTDEDGLSNREDKDDDNDGIDDISDAFPLDKSAYLDSDLDGIPDDKDPTPVFNASDTTTKVTNKQSLTPYFSERHKDNTRLSFLTKNPQLLLRINDNMSAPQKGNQTRLLQFESSQVQDIDAIALIDKSTQTPHSATISLARQVPWEANVQHRQLKLAPNGPSANYQSITFQGKTWVIGGANSRPSNEIWYSDNGVHWFKSDTRGDIFTPRTHHQTFVFQNKIWIMGGQTHKGGNRKVTLQDIWSSKDGITWELVADNTAIGKVAKHKVLVFNNQLWSFGGSRHSPPTQEAALRFDGSPEQEIAALWSSPNGKHWYRVHADKKRYTQIQSKHPFLFDNKLWIFTSNRQLHSSHNGIDWQIENARLPMTPKALKYKRLHRLNHRLLLIGNDSWVSDNGKEWRTVAKSIRIGCASQCFSFVHDKDLIVYGAKLSNTYRSGYQNASQQTNYWKGQSWYTQDGEHWDNFIRTFEDNQLTATEEQLIFYARRKEGRKGYDENYPWVDAWYSRDAHLWTKSEEKNTFPLGHIAHYQNKLWSISKGPGKHHSKALISSSAEGLEWQSEYKEGWQQAQYGLNAISSFNNKLFAYGLGSVVRVLEKGSWSQHSTQHLDCPTATGSITVKSERLWYLCHTKLHSSKDGIHWQLESEQDIAGDQILAFKGHLYRIGKRREENNTRKLYLSQDGYDWQAITHPFLHELEKHTRLTIFNDSLYLITGETIKGRPYMRVLHSPDGKNWTSTHTGYLVVDQ